MSYLTPERLRAALRPQERDEESPLLGGVVRLREPSRAAYRDAGRLCRLPDDLLDLDVFNAAIFAACVVDPNTGDPIFADHTALMAFVGYGSERWEEVKRLASAAIELGQVSPAHLKSGGAGADD